MLFTAKMEAQMIQTTRLLVLLFFIILITLLIVFFTTLFQGGSSDDAFALAIKNILPLLGSGIIIFLFQKWFGEIFSQMSKFIDERIYPLVAGIKKVYLKQVKEYYLDFNYSQYGTEVRKLYPNNMVYEPLDLEPKEYGKEKVSGSIWQFLNEYKSTQTFVVIGKPGSGKSTLLKDMLLSFSSKDEQVQKSNLQNLIPVFVEIKRYYRMIIEKDGYTLAELVNRVASDLGVSLPRNFCDRNIKNGRFIILIDGLDEVPTETQRMAVIEWLDQQIRSHRSVKFIITSRPYGYSTGQIAEAFVLTIRNYSKKQVEDYIEKWIVANEIREAGVYNSGLRVKAKSLTRELLDKLELRPGLRSLANTPLITKMIVTVHVKKARLPGRRVQLYGDLFDVSIGKNINKWEAKGLREDKVMEVWKTLAYYMMENHEVEPLKEDIASLVINEKLRATGAQISTRDFFTMSIDLTGLLNEDPPNHYTFAHSTFRDYLASLYILDDKTNLEKKLIEKIGDPWWVETIRLYAAATDATTIVEESISEESPSQTALSIAIDCMIEAKTIKSDIRKRFEQYLQLSLEGSNVESRRLASEAILSSRLRWMEELGSGNIAIDNGYIENCEYQLFIDTMAQSEHQVIPDCWNETVFPDGQSRKYVLGIRPSDAQEFCNWLTRRDLFDRRYRLPSKEEIDAIGDLSQDLKNIAFWILDNSAENNISLYPATNPNSISQFEVVARLNQDLSILRRLGEAIKSKNELTSSAQILSRQIDLGTGGTVGTKLGVAGQEMKIVHEITDKRRNSDMLNEYLRHSKVFGYELERFINILSTRFIQTLNDTSDFTGWLSGSNNSYVLYPNWIMALENSQRVADQVVSQFSLNQFDKFVINQMQSASEDIKNRKWSRTGESTRKDIALQYNFLRWFTRVGLVYLATTSLTEGTNLKPPTINKAKLREVCEIALANLTRLEHNIEQNTHPSIGIRLVQEKRGLGEKRG